MKYFISHMKKYNLTYAIGYALWSTLDKLHFNRKPLRYKAACLQDNIEAMLDRYDGHLQLEGYEYEPLPEREPTPCGCIYFNGCRECGSYPMCDVNGN